MKNKYHWPVILFLMIFLCGCNTLQAVKALRGKGVANIYSYPYKTMYTYTRNAIFKCGIRIREENMEKGYIYAEGPFSEWSWGEWIAVYIEKMDDNNTKVEIVSRKKVATHVLATDWSEIIFPLIDGQINKEKQK